MSEGTLSFSELEAVVAKSCSISYQKRDTFRSRLKQWQKMGFPRIAPVGRGSKQKYALKHVFQLTTLLRLLDCGLTPEPAISVLAMNWLDVQDGIQTAIYRRLNSTIGITPEGVYALVEMNALGHLRWDEPKTPVLNIVDASDLAALYHGPKTYIRPEEFDVGLPFTEEGASIWIIATKVATYNSIIIDLSDMVERTLYGLHSTARSVGDFAEELANWRTDAQITRAENKADIAANWENLSRAMKEHAKHRERVDDALAIQLSLLAVRLERDEFDIAHPARPTAENSSGDDKKA